MLLGIDKLPKVANELFNALHEDEAQIIEELYQACQRENLQEIDRLMELLIYDVEDHFSTEEELMREAEFFAYPMHKAEHDSMRRDIKNLYDNWKIGKNVKEIEKKMVPWLLLHISRWDSITAIHIGD